MHVHIAMAGREAEPAIRAFNAIPGIDRLVILTCGDAPDSVKALEDLSARAMVPSEIIEVDGSDYREASDVLCSVIGSHRVDGTGVSVDITGGTGPMVAAACSASFLSGAGLCHVVGGPDMPVAERLVWIPVPRAPDMRRIRGRTEEILRLMLEDPEMAVTSAEICSRLGLGKQSVSYHVGILEEEGLVEKVRGAEAGGRVDNRRNTLRLTGEGRLAAGLLLNQMP